MLSNLLYASCNAQPDEPVCGINDDDPVVHDVNESVASDRKPDSSTFHEGAVVRLFLKTRRPPDRHTH